MKETFKDYEKRRKKETAEKSGHWLQGAVNPKKAGMFDDVPTKHIAAELSELKKSGPHKQGSKQATREHELMFALRARKGHGFKSK